LRSQIATSKDRRGGRRHVPLVFTEQGVAILSSVLKSDRAIQVKITIMRAFVGLRELVATLKDLARKLEAMEKKYDADSGWSLTPSANSWNLLSLVDVRLGSEARSVIYRKVTVCELKNPLLGSNDPGLFLGLSPTPYCA
jgi:hypothetical protein